ncbi:MAG: LysR family transcriptional regulator [Betaproteobacteria bacterium]|nr:LysR family transcriptional regulator [Betaproteobacteria bacterium]
MGTTALPARYAQLRLRDLMLLEHLDEQGSLTEVAARMHVTQSAVTQALQSLEEAFGVALVARGRRGQRGVRLTPAGTAALMHLRVARHELEAALAAASDPGTLDLRIGALPLTLVHPLPDALARLRQRLPRVHVRLTEGTVPELWRRLEGGEFDAIVCRLPALSEQPRLPAGVQHLTVGHESLVLVCGQGHPIARRRKPALTLLREYDWVLPPEGSYTRLTIEQRFMRAGLAGPRAAVTSMNFHANLRLAAEGSLLAVAPRSAALAVRDVLGLSLFTMDWGREDTDVTLVWREASLGNPALVAFLECF